MPCKYASFLTASAPLRYTPPTFSGLGHRPSSRCSRPWSRPTTAPRRVNARIELLATGEGEYRLHDPDTPRPRARAGLPAGRAPGAPGSCGDLRLRLHAARLTLLDALAPPTARELEILREHIDPGQASSGGPRRADGADRAEPRDERRRHLDPTGDTFPKLSLRNAERVRRQGRHPREGLRHLAVLHLARSTSSRRGSSRSGLAALGFAARRQDGDRRRQPPAALLGHARHPGARRRAGAALPGLHREGDGVHRRPRARPASRWSRTRSRSTSSSRSRRACPRLEHIVYDDARGLRHYEDAGLLSLAALQELGRQFEREHPGYFERGGGARAGRTTSRSSATRRARPASPRATMLSLPEPDRDRPERRSRARGSRATDEVVAYLPDGVDRRPHVLVRPVDRHRLHDQLPGEHGDGAARPPGDRPDLLLRPAAASTSAS